MAQKLYRGESPLSLPSISRVVPIILSRDNKIMSIMSTVVVGGLVPRTPHSHQVKLNFLRPAVGSMIRGRGRVKKIGRTVAVCEIEANETGPEMGHVRLGKPNNLLLTQVGIMPDIIKT